MRGISKRRVQREPVRNPWAEPAIATEAAQDVGLDEILGESLMVEGAPQPLPGMHADRKPYLDFWDCKLGPPITPTVTVVGLHGGCGASTVTRLLGADKAHETPRVVPTIGGQAVPATLLVARCSGYGLWAAGQAAQDWSAGLFGETKLLGLILVADLPKTPPVLATQAKAVMRLFPRTWRIGWQPDWHLSHAPNLAELPLRVRKSVESINKAIAALNQ